MSNTRFRSLPSAAFSVAVSQSGAQAELTTGSVAPPDSDHKVTISANRTNAMATGCIYFRPTTIEGFDVDHPEQDLLFVWNFGDPGSKFADLSGRLDMLNRADPTQKKWNDANVGYGHFVAHAYRKPGTYSVYCDVYYSHARQPVRSNTITITVDDPDEIFSDAQTIYASTGTDFSGAPAGAKTITTSYGDEAYWALSDGPRRVRFKRGDKFTSLDGKGNPGKLLIDDWGNPDDPRPVFDTTTGKNIGFGGSDPRNEVVVKNIQSLGTFNMETMSGEGNGIGIGNDARGHFLFENLLVSGVPKSCISGTKGWEDEQGDLCLLDCEVTDWLHYGIYGKFPTVALMGTWVHANLDGYKMNSDSGGGAAHRIEAFGILSDDVYPWGGAYFCCTDCFQNYSGRFIGDQPGYKVQGDAVKDSRWVWDRVISEGSTDTSSGVGSTIADRQNAVIDKHIHIGTAQCGYPLHIQNGGTTVRNFYYISPHVRNEKIEIKNVNNPYALAYGVDGSGGQTADNRSSWFYTYGNTAVVWPDWATQTEFSPEFNMVDPGCRGRMADEVVSNIVLHAPFSGAMQRAEVDTSLGVTGIARYRGRKQTSENGGKLQTQYATPQQFSFGDYTNQYTVCIPRPTGANLTADTGTGERVPFDYIDGTIRGSKPAKGAFKP